MWKCEIRQNKSLKIEVWKVSNVALKGAVKSTNRLITTNCILQKFVYMICVCI